MPASLSTGWSNVAYRMFAAGACFSSVSTAWSINVVFPICRAPESRTALDAGGVATTLKSSWKTALRHAGRSLIDSPLHHGLNWARMAISSP